MTGRSIRRAMAVLAAAALTATLASTALAAEVDPSAKKKPVVKCAGKVATKVGTPKRDIIRGTVKRDIIAGLGGNDIILGRGGNDVICGGAGNDRIAGGAGHDKLLGQTGRDRLFGGTGVDRLFGGQQNDFLAGQAGPDLLFGGAGSDKLDGGVGVDTCYQGTGIGALIRCELPKAPVVPVDPGPTLHDLAGVLAIAYCDIDGLDGYSTGDKLIAKLVDTNGDGMPSGIADVGPSTPADTIVMGRYPKDFGATTFGDWTVTSHQVEEAHLPQPAGRVQVADAGTGIFMWWRTTNEAYREEGIDASSISDCLVSPGPCLDTIYTNDSPSDADDWIWESSTDFADGGFIDVEVFYQP